MAPDGTVYPCPAAAALPVLDAPDVADHSLKWIWHGSRTFSLYRGEAWMRDPCRTCDLRARDFGGCRCRAHALTGDAARTDPACHLSPDHALVRDLVDAPRTPGPRPAGAVPVTPPYVYRDHPDDHRAARGHP